jgi:hypothetical protein
MGELYKKRGINPVMENEKRAYVRGNCFCEAEVIIDEEDDLIEEVSVIDLAAGGLKFTTENSENELNAGETYLLRLKIDESDIHIDEILTNVKIRRSELTGGNVRIYGAEFLELSEEQGIRIDEIIQHKKRLSGEF